jgi:hypothetical protein
VTPTELASFPPTKNVPEIAPKTKTSTASANVRAHRRLGAWATPSTEIRTGSACATTARGGCCGRRCGRSRGSGRRARARSARTGSTSTSSGLIGPRLSKRRTSSGPASTSTVLQVPRLSESGVFSPKCRSLQVKQHKKCAFRQELTARWCKRAPNAQTARGQLAMGSGSGPDGSATATERSDAAPPARRNGGTCGPCSCSAARRKMSSSRRSEVGCRGFSGGRPSSAVLLRSSRSLS